MACLTPKAFLRAAAKEPWEVGWSDCIGVVARWIEHCGRGPAAGFLTPRGDEDAARLWLGVHGGLLGAMQSAAERLGLPRTIDPAPGDVAHLALAGGQESAGIRIGTAWGAKGKGGLVIVTDRIVVATAWSIR